MKLCIIGGGHMAHALVGGLTDERRRHLTVIDRNEERRRIFARDFGVEVRESIEGVAAELIVIAVRPPQVGEVCGQIKGTRALIVSVAAGLGLVTLGRWLDSGRIVRAMPNTSLQVGLGMTVCADAGVSDEDRDRVKSLFSDGGKVVWVKEEGLIHAAVAVSGSGPAYVYYFIEAMQAAARELGLADDMAQTMILQTLRGAVEMVAGGERTASELREAVAVPGGTTEQALRVMQERGFADIVGEAMRACHRRAEALATPAD